MELAHTTAATLATATDSLLAVFLSGKSAKTTKAYAADVADFAAFAGLADAAGVARYLVNAGQGEANRKAHEWRAAMLAANLSPATTNRRLAALRSLVTLARTFAMVAWSLDVPSVKAAAYRDTKGCGRDGVAKMLAAAQSDRSAKGVRDVLVLRLLWDLGLRRAELCGLDVADYDDARGVLAVLGKGKRERVLLTVPAPTAAAIRSWLAVRGIAAGPLVGSLDHARKGARLTGAGLYEIVRVLGERAGVVARPHGVRHASITHALDTTRGDVRAVQRFSRHADLRTLTRYDDNRTDFAGSIAAAVSAAV